MQNRPKSTLETIAMPIGFTHDDRGQAEQNKVIAQWVGKWIWENLLQNPEDPKAPLPYAVSSTCAIRPFPNYVERFAEYASADFYDLVRTIIYLNRYPIDHCRIFDFYRLFLTAFVIQAKFFQDDHISQYNKRMAQVGGVSTGEINDLEIEFLREIEWNLSIDKNTFHECQQRILGDLEKTVEPASTVQIKMALSNVKRRKYVANDEDKFSTGPISKLKVQYPEKFKLHTKNHSSSYEEWSIEDGSNHLFIYHPKLHGCKDNITFWDLPNPRAVSLPVNFDMALYNELRSKLIPIIPSTDYWRVDNHVEILIALPEENKSRDAILDIIYQIYNMPEKLIAYIREIITSISTSLESPSEIEPPPKRRRLS